VVIARLRTSQEKLPSCKVDATTVVDGYCFVTNACYAEGQASRALNTQACLSCSPADSQTSFTLADGSCLIDGVCYFHGMEGTECQYCDALTSTDSWTLRDGWYVANGACYERAWTTHSATVPDFDWVIVDHAGGDSYSLYSAVGDGALFVSGLMANSVNLTNVVTGESLASIDEDNDQDIYLAKISLEGKPLAIWTYPTTNGYYWLRSNTTGPAPDEYTFPDDLTYGDGYVAVAGTFAGEIVFGPGDKTVTATGQQGYVAKLDANDGTALWAKAISFSRPVNGSSELYRPRFNVDGDVAVGGSKCSPDWEVCIAFLTLLDGATGETKWERDFGENVTWVQGLEITEDTYYLTGAFTGQFAVQNDMLLDAGPTWYAYLLALDYDGRAKWAATASPQDPNESDFQDFWDVRVVDDAVYVQCWGLCDKVQSTASNKTISFEGVYLANGFPGQVHCVAENNCDGEGIAKFSTDGEPLWAADVPTSGYTISATKDAVYHCFPVYQQTLTFGTERYTNWGSLNCEGCSRTDDGLTYTYDLFVAKIDAETGKGQWVLQTGGQGDEGWAQSCAADISSGDLLYTGRLHSKKAFYDPLVVDSHDFDDGNDVVIARLRTSQEKLPSCKVDATTVTAGFCFINNVCFEEGAFSRATLSEACKACLPEVSQTSFTTIEGYVELPSGECAVAPNGMLANYAPGTPVAAQALIDLDQKELEALADAGNWSAVAAVYQTGGNSVVDGSVRTLVDYATTTTGTYWMLYRDYYDDDVYADTFVKNAYDATGKWASRSDALRAELAAKGTSYQAVWMAVVRGFEDAAAQCVAANGTGVNATSAAWDEAWALYAGSLEGLDGSGDGYLLHSLAEKRCLQFATCDADGKAIANVKALMAAKAGLDAMRKADCSGVAEQIPGLVRQMTIPEVQGMVRYAYLADPAVNGGSCDTTGACTYDKAWAEAWAFAAAVLPQIDACDSFVAAEIAENLDVDTPVGTPLVDGFAYVKGLVESVYDCLGITCDEIGQYLQDDGTAYPGMEACGVRSGWERHEIDLSAPWAGEVHTGDVNRDGTVDVVASSWGDHRFTWHSNLDGNGTQWSENLISDNVDGVGDGPTTVFLCDLDGDGDLDTISGSVTDHVIAWHENSDGNGSTWIEHVVEGTNLCSLF